MFLPSTIWMFSFIAHATKHIPTSAEFRTAICQRKRREARSPGLSDWPPVTTYSWEVSLTPTEEVLLLQLPRCFVFSKLTEKEKFVSQSQTSFRFFWERVSLSLGVSSLKQRNPPSSKKHKNKKQRILSHLCRLPEYRKAVGLLTQDFDTRVEKPQGCLGPTVFQKERERKPLGRTSSVVWNKKSIDLGSLSDWLWMFLVSFPGRSKSEGVLWQYSPSLMVAFLKPADQVHASSM